MKLNTTVIKIMMKQGTLEKKPSVTHRNMHTEMLQVMAQETWYVGRGDRACEALGVPGEEWKWRKNQSGGFEKSVISPQARCYRSSLPKQAPEPSGSSHNTDTLSQPSHA